MSSKRSTPDAKEFKAKVQQQHNASGSESEVVPTVDFSLDDLPLDHFLFLLDFPEVTFDPNDQLAPQPICSESDEEFDIHISETFSPVHFWFQLNGADKKLMDQLQNDYEKLNAVQLAISDCNIKPGLLVAAYHNYYELWHRVQVIQPPDEDGRVRLFFIDFGTVAMVPKGNIKLLMKEYLKSPRISHRGRLVNVMPPLLQPSFSGKQVEGFLNLTRGQKLKAKIMKFDDKTKVYDLEVLITIEDETRSLRDVLIERCFAVGFEIAKRSILPFCYNSPTIEMLENNHPTLDELAIMSENSIDILMETNGLSCVDKITMSKNPRLVAMLGLPEFKEVKKYYSRGQQ